jgi:hypothetical protein
VSGSISNWRYLMIKPTGPICALFSHFLAVYWRGFWLCPFLAYNCGFFRKAPRSRCSAQGRYAPGMVDKVRCRLSNQALAINSPFRKVFGRKCRDSLTQAARDNMSVNALQRQRVARDDASFDSP